MEKKIVVPEFMLRAAYDAQLPADNPSFSWDEAEEFTREFYRRVLGAALRALSENPIVPNHEQAIHLCEIFEDKGGSRKPDYCGSIRQVAVEWQRLMFLAPEMPKFMECDACRAKSGSPYLCQGCAHNRALIESLQLGQKAGK